MLIKLKKIRRITEKDEAGRHIPHPVSDEKLTKDSVVEESINVHTIKSIRPFKKDGHAHRNIDGDVCVIYLLGDKRTAEIHVIAEYNELVEEVNELKRNTTATA